MFNSSRVNQRAKAMARLAGVRDIEEKVTAPAPFFLTSIEIGAPEAIAEKRMVFVGDDRETYRAEKLAFVKLVTDERWKLFRRVALESLLADYMRENGG
jgi:hypothetical protein